MHFGTFKPFVVLMLGAVDVASLGSLLYVSWTRGFLPGVVELSTALGVAVLVASLYLIIKGKQAHLLEQLRSMRTGPVTALAVLTGGLALTAAVAIPVDGFAWPAGLLGALFLAYVVSIAADKPQQAEAS